MSVFIRPSSYNVQLMQPEDFDQVSEICTSFGWFLSKYETDLARAVDPEGCFVAKENETGRVLGMCVGIIHSASFGFIGIYGVRQEYQGQGIGHAIWSRVMEHLEPDKRNISLYAVPQMFPVYRDKLGFKLVPEKRMQKWNGRADTSILPATVDGISVVDVTSKNIDAVVEYDKDVCEGLDRRVWLVTAMNLPEMVFLVAVNQSDCRVKGCCALTPTNIGTVLCQQLYADDSQIAECLLSNACQRSKAASTIGFHMVGWDCNNNTPSIAKKIGLEFASEEPVLFTKKVLDGNMNKIFNVNSMGVYPF